MEKDVVDGRSYVLCQQYNRSKMKRRQVLDPMQSQDNSQDTEAPLTADDLGDLVSVAWQAL